MYNGCNSCGYARSNGNFSWIIWILIILFVLGVFDNNGCGGESVCESAYSRNNGCGCGCN